VNLYFTNIDKVSPGPGLGNISIPSDQHFIGSATSIITTTLFYRAFLLSLTSLVDELKARQLFDKTILHISSEFNRSPRVDGSGSDHAPQGSNTTLISGMIKGANVLGNILVNSPSTSYPGTWGTAAPWKLDSESRAIRVNDVARTITAMTGAKDIVSNGYSLFRPENGQWVPKVSGGGSNV
jgi:hypothetical protein